MYILYNHIQMLEHTLSVIIIIYSNVNECISTIIHFDEQYRSVLHHYIPNYLYIYLSIYKIYVIYTYINIYIYIYIYIYIQYIQ